MPTAVLKDPNAIDGIIKSKDLVRKGRFIHIYGVSGSRKTRLAAQWPNPFFFDFDDGLESAKEFKWDAKCYAAPTEEDRAKSFAEFKKDWRKVFAMPYGTYVFDSLTTMGDAALSYAQYIGGRLGQHRTQAEWGIAIEELTDLFYDVKGMGKNVITISVEELFKDEWVGKVRERPMIIGRSLPQNMPLWYDEFWRMEVITMPGDKEPDIVMHTSPGPTFVAKSRSNMPSIKNPTYEKIKGYFK